MSVIYNLLVVDEHNRLGDKWIPKDLIWDPINCIWIVKNVYEAFYKLNHSLQQEGVPALRIGAGYRSYAMQKKLYEKSLFLRISKLSEDEVPMQHWCDRQLPPGTSEHQLGTVIDIVPGQVMEDGIRFTQEDMQAQAGWLKGYARDYGFILTDERQKPWHYRYVGVGHAKKMNRLGIEIDAYVQYIKKHCSI